MRVLVISDLHANWRALEAVLAAEPYDRLIVCGDLVAHGPHPAEVVEFVQTHAAVAVRGNHDHALAYGVDARSLPAMRFVAEGTRALHLSMLSADHVRYLRRLPLTGWLKEEGFSFYAAHASPRNRLYAATLTPDASDRHVEGQARQVRADYVLLGHTHVPMVRGVGFRLVVNPGSLGQPCDGDPRASYAVIEDGTVKLRRATYDVERTVSDLSRLPLDAAVVERLAFILRTGTLK